MMKSLALEVMTSAISSSFQRAAFPPVIQPMRGDAVDDGVVVALTGLQGDEFGVFESGGPVAYFVVVADGDGVVGVESCHAAVFDEYAGYAVDGGGDDVFVVESDVLGVRSDEGIEVGAAFGAESEVPFADGGGGVAFGVEHVGQGDARRCR